MRNLLAIGLVLAACGGGGTDNPDAPPGTPDAAGEAPGLRVDHHGQIALIEGWGAYVMLFDRAFEQPVPSLLASDGDCALYRRPNPTCPGGCGADACVADDTCAPYALRASAGDITITGLRQPAVFTPSEFGYTGPTLPADMFADDATIHVSAAGDEIAAFIADLGGVAPLVEPTGGGLIELQDAVDETIHWTAGAGDARIQLALYLGWHGSPWTDLLVCETADDGELVVPSSLIDQFPYFEGGLFQWPSWITRFRRVWAGDIEVIASSQVTLGVSHTP